MKAVQYILVDSKLRMPAGKLAAQAAHAAVMGYRLSTPTMIDAWLESNHYTKIVLGCDDLAVAERYINDRGVSTALIIDEGRTVFSGQLTPTCLGCQIVDKDNPHIAGTFGIFKLYNEPAPAQPQFVAYPADSVRAARPNWFRRLL